MYLQHGRLLGVREAESSRQRESGMKWNRMIGLAVGVLLVVGCVAWAGPIGALILFAAVGLLLVIGGVA